MMAKITHVDNQGHNGKTQFVPCLKVSKLGIVSRDYNHKYKNGYKDFSNALPGVLKILDKNKCDTVLFSLYSILSRPSYSPCKYFKGLQNIKAVLLEEYYDKGKKREPQRYVIYYRTRGRWEEYELKQGFGSLKGKTQEFINDFVQSEIPKRVLGNSCILLCGETNGVKYSMQDKKVHDDFGLMKAFHGNVEVVLNPIHDRMTRFEMKLKRQFLSKSRWVVSVWNKGKKDKNNKTKDGKRPAWTIFHNGKEIDVKPEPNKLDVEICIIDIKR